MNLVLQTLDAFFSLNWGFIFQFVLENLHWLFVFAAVAFFFYEKKNWFWSIVYLVFFVWAFGAALQFTGWQFPPVLIALDFVVATAYFAVEPSSPWFSKHFGRLSVFRFLIPMILLNLFFWVVV